MTDDQPEKCKIWGTKSTYIGSGGDFVILNSSRAGGKYKITNSAMNEVKNLNVGEKVGLTGWLVEQRKNGIDCPVLDSYILPSAKIFRRLSVTERVDRLLFWLTDFVPSLGMNLPVGTHIQGYADHDFLTENMDLLCAHIGSANSRETMEVVDFAVKSNFVEAAQYKRFDGGFLSLTFEGHQRVELLRSQSIESSQGFVAMWFSKSLDNVYENGFKLAIEDAGYISRRIDKVDHNNKIDDEIIVEIRRSKFVVADFTSEVIERNASGEKPYPEAISRGGVYFEAGFAKGLGREVIWTVSKDVMDKNVIHFDTRQFNHIVWTSLEDLRDKLSKRIIATLDVGPVKKLK